MVCLEDVEHITLPAGSCRYDYLLAVCKSELGYEEDDNDEYYLRDVYLDDNPIKITNNNLEHPGKNDDKKDESVTVTKILDDEPKPAVSKLNTMTFDGPCLSRLRIVLKQPRTRSNTPESVVSSPSDYDKEELELNLSSNKRRKRSRRHDQVSNKRSSSRNNNGLEPPPGLPAEFKNLIRQLARNRSVSVEKLVIQKQLTETDVNNTQNRLSIPMKHIKEQFLTDEEYDLLCMHDGKNVGSMDDVPFITPTMEVAKVSLRRWEMRKETGPSSVSYVITNTWNKIKAQIKLRSGMIVQLWAFRVDGELWFALVRLT